MTNPRKGVYLFWQSGTLEARSLTAKPNDQLFKHLTIVRAIVQTLKPKPGKGFRIVRIVQTLFALLDFFMRANECVRTI